jgi:hypothetical protein
MLMRIFLVSVLALIQNPALLAQNAPLPAKLVGARTAFLVNDGTWSDLPPFSVPIIKRVPGQFLAFVVLSGAAGGGEPPRRL